MDKTIVNVACALCFAFGFAVGVLAQGAIGPKPMTGAEMAAAIADCESHGLKAGPTVNYGYQVVGINCEPKGSW